MQTAMTVKLSPALWGAADDMNQTINKALLSGQFDVLADENRLDDWPEELGRLSEQIFRRSHQQSRTGGELLQHEIDFHLEMKFGIGPESGPGDPHYLQLARYFAACDVLGSQGWWRDRGSGRSDGSITVLRADRGGIRIHLFWELQHVHARIAVSHMREPERHFLFTLSDGGVLMAVDGLLPEGPALRQGEWEALRQVMLCLREIQLDRQQRSYQRMMDQAH
ncbi:hypothetical protein CVS28_05565 [Arthrobacter glacialis]|nr:hypothetical protein CVS28_05565 [Arthrobacter glacialis]